MAKKRKPAAKKKVVKKKNPAPKKKVAKKASKKPVVKKAVARVRRAAAPHSDTAGDVKQRIITSSPLTDIGVEDLTDELLLKENLSYGTDNFHALQASLEEYVNDRDGSKHVSTSDVTNNKSVGSMVKMVKTKLNEV